MLIKPIVLSLLETTCNHYLALADNRTVLLTPLVGKVIALVIQPFNFTLYLCPTEDGIQFIDQYQLSADTTLTGSLAAFGLMGLSATPMRSLFQGDITISGDVRLGQHLQKLFASLDIDLQDTFAQLAGERLAERSGQTLTAIKDWSSDALHSLKLNTSELLQEETRELPAPAEAEILYQQIDVLRNDYDRLHARVQRLQQALQTLSDKHI